MDFDHINQLINDKKWHDVVTNIESILLKNRDEDFSNLIILFEAIDQNYRDKYCVNLYLKLWQPALNLGKIKTSKTYALKAIDILIKFKRTPILKTFINELKAAGILKTNSYDLPLKIISGHAPINQISPKNEFWDLMQLHPEKWKTSKEFLKMYLLHDDDWNADHWKLAYEFILNFSFDKEIIILLADKTINQNMEQSLEKFNNYFETKKIKRTLSTRPAVIKITEKQNEYKIDYDVLALKVLSGESEPTIEAQRKVIFSLNAMTEAELRAKGSDMLVAFSLLGMELVVINLGEKLINITEDVKQRASIHYTCAVAMYENQQFHKVIDIVNDIIDIEPLLPEEVMAFEYLKAEALLKLNRVKDARTIFTKIKKWNPHFRLVSQRLIEIEAP